jgi:hypothetical protein
MKMSLAYFQSGGFAHQASHSLIRVEQYADRTYKVCGGTWYNHATPDDLVRMLEAVRMARVRVVLDYGNIETGRQWGDGRESLNVGRISRSMGPVAVPILVHNSRSMDGGAILDSCIVRIRLARGKSLIYQHPEYHLTSNAFTDWAKEVEAYLNGVPHAYSLSTGTKAEGMFNCGYDPAVAAAEIRNTTH